MLPPTRSAKPSVFATARSRGPLARLAADGLVLLPPENAPLPLRFYRLAD
ncbi:hypothetical protein ABTX81_05740 [Kitasatospora sp. NPDC097605]